MTPTKAALRQQDISSPASSGGGGAAATGGGGGTAATGGGEAASGGGGTAASGGGQKQAATKAKAKAKTKAKAGGQATQDGEKKVKGRPGRHGDLLLAGGLKEFFTADGSYDKYFGSTWTSLTSRNWTNYISDVEKLIREEQRQRSWPHLRS